MRTISEYINSDKTPMVTQTEDKPECCIETVERIPYDEYHKWLCENSDIPNLEIDENGDIVESDGTPKKNGVRYVGPADCQHMTYAQYFNIRFWNHCCWYKNPFSVLCGYGRHGHADRQWGCCEAEQLVYPGSTPSHAHEGLIDCGCDGHSGSGSYRPDKDSSCGCFSWDVI